MVLSCEAFQSNIHSYVVVSETKREEMRSFFLYTNDATPAHAEQHQG